MKSLITLSLLLIVQAAHAFYEPSLGRWINRDPIGEDGGLNLYVYVSNDPIDRYDPFGEADAPKDQPLVTSPPTFGEKPFNPDVDNCLCYALDRPGRALQPDGGNGAKNAQKCKALLIQIKTTFKGVVDVPKGGKCLQGSHKITVFSDEGTPGYHVQRQDSGGGWSEMSLWQYAPRKCTNGKGPGTPCGDLCASDQPKSPAPPPSR